MGRWVKKKKDDFTLRRMKVACPSPRHQGQGSQNGGVAAAKRANPSCSCKDPAPTADHLLVLHPCKGGASTEYLRIFLCQLLMDDALAYQGTTMYYGRHAICLFQKQEETGMFLIYSFLKGRPQTI